MSQIKTIYLISHTHTDIGYTDHQTVLNRQQLEFIDRAIDLCEATADYPPEAQYKWTCEVAAFAERYLRERPAAQVDRFLKYHQEGRLTVAAMAYHWTPMLSPAAMVRSLYPVMRLRQEFDLNITSAMQCDVNGASWLWADLLPACGITGLTMSINPHRGRRPRPLFSPFWWAGPGGNRLLTFDGPHYAYGILQWGLGELERAERLLPPLIDRLEQSEDYPYDFLYAQATHPARPDNGFPYEALPDFVRAWNDTGNTLRMEFITLDDFIAMLHQRYAKQLPTRRGDWVDWWADGVASSAYETGLNRTTEALLPGLDLLAAQSKNLDHNLIEEAYHQISLYDEHTWGAFISITQPDSPFTRAQWNSKAGCAYDGFSITHELLAKAGRQLAETVTGQLAEGNVWQRWRQHISPDDTEKMHRFLLVNPLGWTRQVACAVPPYTKGVAPSAFLEAYLAGNYRDRHPQTTRLHPEQQAKMLAHDPNANLLLQTTLPPFGYQVIASNPADASPSAQLGEGTLENSWYKIEIDPTTGGLRSWYDKELGRELAVQKGPWQLGQYVYEWVDHQPDGRMAIFAPDFTQEDYGVGHRDTPFRRRGAAQVEVTATQIEAVGSSIELIMQAPGARSVRVRYLLPHHEKSLHIDMVVDKEYVTQPEAIYVTFPFALENPTFHLDLNGVPLEPEIEQLPGSCRDWYGIQRWAEVSDKNTSIVMVPVDAPLVQVGGIQTGRWAEKLNAQQATLVSWPVQNHWDTNFQAGQNGELLFRYRLTSLAQYDSAAASRFAAENLVPPLIVRVPEATPGNSAQFLHVEPEGVADVQLKQADDSRGVIVRAFNFTAKAQKLALQFPAVSPAKAWICSPIEADKDTLAVENKAISLNVPSRSLACARVVFAG